MEFNSSTIDELVFSWCIGKSVIVESSNPNIYSKILISAFEKLGLEVHYPVRTPLISYRRFYSLYINQSKKKTNMNKK